MSNCTECGGKNLKSLEYEFFCKGTSETGGIITTTPESKWNFVPSIVSGGVFTIPEGTLGFTIINLTKTENWTLNGGTISSLLDTLNGGGLNINHITEDIIGDAGTNTLQLILQVKV
jgi:hypothetical protein